MHIGLIGGIGPAATTFYYRHLVRTHAGARRPLELTMVHADMSTLLRNMAESNAAAQADVFFDLTRRLQGAGADVVAITSLAGHFCVQEFERHSPLPVVNAIPAVREALARRRVMRVGLIGTRVVMVSRFYEGLGDVDVIVPEGDALAETDREYLALARAGRADARSREFFLGTAQRLQAAGAEVVLLAGTDLFLAFDGHDCGVPTLDCALTHVEALTALSAAPPS